MVSITKLIHDLLIEKKIIDDEITNLTNKIKELKEERLELIKTLDKLKKVE